MPELPEVEVVAKNLQPILENKLITDVWTSNMKLRSQLSNSERDTLINKKIIKIFRRAKFLVIELESLWFLIHFGMTGRIFVSNTEKTIFLSSNKHIHLSFKAGSNYIYFQDIRRFGALHLLEKTKLNDDLDLLIPFKLGIEPLSEEFNTEFLHLKSRNINQPVKPWLMSGYPIAGVGNIYASEALFRAGISPLTKVKSIGLVRSSRLVSAIKFVLTDAVRYGGSSIKNYSNAYGKPGSYSKNHLVYGKKNQLCLVCSEILSFKYITQRSSFYCKKCQKK